MMSKFAMVPVKIAADRRLNLNDYRVLIALIARADPVDGTCYPSRQQLKEDTGLPATKISVATTRLAAFGYIEKTSHRGPSNPAVYRVGAEHRYASYKDVTDSVTLNPIDVTDSVTPNPARGYRIGNPEHTTRLSPCSREREDIFSARAREEPHPSTARAERAPPPQTAKSEKSKRGTRLPDDWTLPDDWREWAEQERPGLNVTQTEAVFRDYWIAQSGQRAVKRDWFATWRNWVRNERVNGNGKNGHNGTKSVAATALENKRWLNEQLAKSLAEEERHRRAVHPS